MDELRREKDALETLLNEASQQRDKLEFEISKLKDSTNNQKQELEFQLNAKIYEIEILKVENPILTFTLMYVFNLFTFSDLFVTKLTFVSRRRQRR